MKTKFLALILVGIIAVTGCGRRGGGRKRGVSETREERAISVIVNTLQPRDLKEYIYFTGKLEGTTDINMASETSGQIIALKKKLGDWVEKGEEIGHVDNEDYRIRVEQAEASVLAAEAAYESAELQMQSAEQLLENKSMSKMEYQNYVNALKQTKAALDGAKASLEQAQRAYNNSRFIAPVSGYIVNLPIKVGETISPGQTICGIVNSKKLLIKSGVGETDIGKIREGQSVTITYGEIKEKFDGKIVGLGIKPLPNSASYPIEVELNNRGGKLYPGMVVEGRILSNVYEDVIYTSVNNIKEEYDRLYVFVVDEENRAKKVRVDLGIQVERDVIIADGVDPGQRIVIEGIDNLQDGSLVEVRN